MVREIERNPLPTPRVEQLGTKISVKNHELNSKQEPIKTTDSPIPRSADIFVNKKRLCTPIKDKLISIKRNSEQRISKLADRAGVWLFLAPMEHQIVRKIRPEYPEGFDNKFIEIMKNPNIVPFLLTNHEGLADALTMALISKKLTKLVHKARHNKEFPGFVLTMAKSLEANGNGQGEFVEEAVRQLRPWFHKNSITLDGYVREKDQKKYGLSKEVNFGHNKRLINDIKNGVGRAFFPEASVESGRFIKEPNSTKSPEKLNRGIKFDKLLESILTAGKEEEENRINGMQEFDNSIHFDNLLEIARKYGKEAVFIMAGSHGAFRIIDHNEKKPIPTWKAWRANFNPGNIPVVGDAMKAFAELTADVKIDDSFMDVKVEMPMKTDEMIKEIIENRKDKSTSEQKLDPNEISHYIGKKIAALLPENARGFYK